MNSCSLFCAKFIHNISSHFIYSDLESFLKKIFFCNVLVGIIGIIVLYLNSYQCYLGIRRWLQLWIFVLHALLHVPSTTVFFPPSNPQFDTANYSNIVSWHLLGHAIKSITCFDLQFSRSTRPMYIHSVHKHRGNSFQRQNYKMRLKQRS